MGRCTLNVSSTFCQYSIYKTVPKRKYLISTCLPLDFTGKFIYPLLLLSLQLSFMMQESRFSVLHADWWYDHWLSRIPPGLWNYIGTAKAAWGTEHWCISVSAVWAPIVAGAHRYDRVCQFNRPHFNTISFTVHIPLERPFTNVKLWRSLSILHFFKFSMSFLIFTPCFSEYNHFLFKN